MPDPFQALATYLLGRMKQGFIQKCFAFCVSILLSGLLGFLGGCCVTTLKVLATHSPAVAAVSGVAVGMGTAAVCIALACGLDKTGIFKLLTVVWPKTEILAEISADVEPIQKK